MDVLWAAVAICAIVSLVLYVLAASWQRLLRSHSRAIRDLLQRIETLESMEDPFVRNKIGQLTPSPLEQVHILSFRLSEHFWRDTIGATEHQVRYVHEHGTFVGTVKMEVWRSHVAITLRELLPQSRSADWRTRTLDIYDEESKVLWELCLAPAANSRMTEGPSVQLRYENQSFILTARNNTRQTSLETIDHEPVDERIVFRIPLDLEQLAEFRVRETDLGNDEVGADVAGAFAANGDHGIGNVASFSYQDERQGVDWQLHTRELNGRASSEHWTIMEPGRVRRVS